MGQENSDNNEELHRLYDSFAKAVEEGSDLMEFSSDDLLDVIDYCVHGFNVSIAGEAIIEGLRRSPHDFEFIKRKGFLFYELDDFSACKRIMGTLPENEFVRAALMLRDAAVIQSTEIDEIFRTTLLMFKKESVEDWDIVFLVDLFEDIDKIDIVVRHAAEITRISITQEIIYSELYNLFYDNGHYHAALETAKKLCDINAFDIEAWTELANLYLMKFNDRDAATESAEYALAIDPDHLPALMIKAIALHESDPREARNIVARARKDKGDDRIVNFAAACIDFLDGDELSAVNHIRESVLAFDRLQQRREALDIALRHIRNKQTSENLIDVAAFVLQIDSEINVVEWIEQLKRQGAYCGALCLVRATRMIDRLDYKMAALIASFCEVYYLTGEYEEMKEFISEVYPSRDEWMDLMPGIVMVLYALALYRLGEIDELKTFLDRALNATAEIPDGINIQELIFLRANRRTLQSMRREIDRLPLPLDESLFDPFKDRD